jgi:hypothetical protein
MAFTFSKFKYLLETYPATDLAFLSKVQAFNKTLTMNSKKLLASPGYVITSISIHVLFYTVIFT